MKVIVLSVTPYKNKDGVVNALTENGMISFYARSIMDPKNKNSAINNILAVADIDVAEGKIKYPVLKTCSIIQSPLGVKNDYSILSAVMFIEEVTSRLPNDDEKNLLFNKLLDALNALKNGKNPFVTSLIYVSYLLKITGYNFSEDECALCNSKDNLKAFSFIDGGFICKKCLCEAHEWLIAGDNLKAFKLAYSASNFDVESEYFTKEIVIHLLKEISQFIFDFYGIKLNSISLLDVA